MSYEYIAAVEGVLYTKWGPCFCSEKERDNGDYCISCLNANEIEASGKDWDDEYEKARKERLADSEQEEK